MVFHPSVRWFPGLLAALLLGTAAAAPSLTIAKQRQVRETDAGWQIYRNERYAFRLTYPPDSRVDIRRGHGLQQISIARSVTEQADAERSPVFLVEVLIYDHRLGHKLKMACRDFLYEAHPVRVGKVQGFRGTYPEADNQPEAGPAVCVQSKRLDIVVKAVDDDPQVPLAERILDSLRFGE
jgi:hypothetical protein